MYPGSSVADLSAIDAALKGMELHVQKIKDRLREETQAIPKAKVFSELHYCDFFFNLNVVVIARLIRIALTYFNFSGWDFVWST